MKLILSIFGLISFIILSGCAGRMNKNAVIFPEITGPILVTDTTREHFFASYYGINSFDGTERYITVLETDIRFKLPDENEPATLGLVDLKTNKFIPLTQTRAWNFQQGCMAHWLGTSPDSLIIYNDLRNGKFVSVIMNVHTRKEIKVLPLPVGSVAPDGREALSLNFARLRLTRTDYGYAGEGQDPLRSIKFPENDGISMMNLETGESKLIVSLAQLRGMVPEVSDTGMECINHALISREGGGIFFLARYFFTALTPMKWNTVSFTVNTDGTNLERCFPDGWEGSHFDWLNENDLMVTAKYDAKQYAHVLFTIGKQNYQRLGNGLLDYDGHGTFSPDQRWMVTDSYPGVGLREQKIYLMDMKTEAVLPLGRYVQPPEYTGFWRCDIHCRWSPKGDMIGFNSTHSGRRQVYIFNLKW